MLFKIFFKFKKNFDINKNEYKSISVKNLLLKLKQYKNDYFNNIIPKFDNSFELNHLILSDLMHFKKNNA